MLVDHLIYYTYESAIRYYPSFCPSRIKTNISVIGARKLHNIFRPVIQSIMIIESRIAGPAGSHLENVLAVLFGNIPINILEPSNG